MLNPQKERIQSIQKAEREAFDVIVIGGGIHGANVCREAALRGLRVLLLEAEDYAFGISSRSSKMLHGGIRYLENADFKLVREALGERETFIRNAGHLARPQEFFVPVISGLTRPAWQIKIGLQLYDSLAAGFAAFKTKGKAARFPGHRRVLEQSIEAKRLSSMGLSFDALFAYYDGQMDDSRFVVETIIDSVSLGALTLNHAPVTAINRNQNDKQWHVRWRSNATTEHESRGAYLINMAGPWVPEVDGLIGPWESNWPRAIFSRGVHLLFDVKWKGAGLILPAEKKGRYYFVWPYFSADGRGTLVGTTDDRVDNNEKDPQAKPAEIQELMSLLKRDLPKAGLNEDTLYASFCGTRILAGKPGSTKVSAISRDDYFIERDAYIGLLGGKYTTARSTAEKIVKRIAEKINVSGGAKESTRTRELPGGRGWSEIARLALVQKLLGKLLKIEPTLDDEHLSRRAEAAVNRFGMRASRLFDYLGQTPGGSSEVLPNILRCEIALSIDEEQALTVEDVLRRRLGLSLLPGCGESERQTVEEELERRKLTS